MSKKKMAGKNLAKTAAVSGEVGPDDKWKAESDLRTMMDHHEMMSDPERVKKMKKLVGRHNKAISSLAELRDVANNYSKTKGLSHNDEEKEEIS